MEVKNVVYRKAKAGIEVAQESRGLGKVYRNQYQFLRELCLDRLGMRDWPMAPGAPPKPTPGFVFDMVGPPPPPLAQAVTPPPPAAPVGPAFLYLPLLPFRPRRRTARCQSLP